MAAPRALREEGSMAVGRVDGERMRVEVGKRDWNVVVRRGVCDVPPDRMTSSISITSRSAPATASLTRVAMLVKILEASSSYRVRFIVLV